MRLQRALARAGVASRRRAEDLIRSGTVKVNGVVAHLGMQVDPERDVVLVEGRRIRPVKATWLAFHKPVGCLVSRSDPQGRPTVFALLPDTPGLTYVGRLDYMTSGLLLLTTDGAGTQRLTHPRYAVPRTYEVRVHGKSPDVIAHALRGQPVIDGRKVMITDVSVRAAARGMTDIRLTLTEGRYRIVRKVCAKLGVRVERLKRTSHGPVNLGRLPVGRWRHVTPRERSALEKLVHVHGN
jgi:23S rRNA pseudouridine2605 synthase